MNKYIRKTHIPMAGIGVQFEGQSLNLICDSSGRFPGTQGVFTVQLNCGGGPVVTGGAHIIFTRLFVDSVLVIWKNE